MAEVTGQNQPFSKSLTVCSENKFALEIQRKINDQQQALILFRETIAENNSLICNYAGNLTPEIARKSLVQLSAVKKSMGEKELGILIMKLLAEAGKLTGTEMDTVTQGITAKAIMQEYWGLKYDEIIYVLRQLSIGAYGEVSWKGLSFLDVMQGFKKYMEQREGIIFSEHQENKNSAGNNADRKGVEQSFSDLLNGVTRDKKGQIIRNKSEE